MVIESPVQSRWGGMAYWLVSSPVCGGVYITTICPSDRGPNRDLEDKYYNHRDLITLSDMM